MLSLTGDFKGWTDFILLYALCIYQLYFGSSCFGRYSEDKANQPLIMYDEIRSLFQELLCVSGQD